MNVPRNAAAPGGQTRGEAGNDHQGAGSINSLAPAAHRRAVATLPEFTPEDAAAIAGGAFVVVVQLDEDRYRRRVFLTLAAAERLAEKARERGHVAHVLLSHVLPLGVVAP